MIAVFKPLSLLLAGVLFAGAVSAQLASDKPTQPAKIAGEQKSIVAPATPAVQTASSTPTTMKASAEKKVVGGNKAKASVPSQGTEPALTSSATIPKLAPISNQQATSSSSGKKN